MKRLIRFDWAIKRILRNKANFGILEGLLSELLLDDIKIDSILESESNQNTGDNKSNRLDLLIQNSKGELVLIEIQSNRMNDYLMRMLFGTSKLIIDNMDKGMAYNRIKKVISVNIVYFDLGVGDDYIYHGSTNFVGLHKKDILKLSAQQEKVYHTNEIARIYPEYYILKINQFDDITHSTLDEWIYFLKNEEIKDSFSAKGLVEAKAALDVLKLNEADLKEYDNFIKDWRDMYSLTVLNYNDGLAQGLEQGIKEGAEQKQLEIARRCLEKGMAFADIAALTGLDEQLIAALLP